MKTYVLSALAFVAACAASSALADCQSGIAALADKLPKYNRPGLRSLREKILSTDVRQSIQAGEAQGYSPSQLAAAQLERSRTQDAQRPQAERCVAASAGAPSDALLRLQNGQYDFGGKETVPETCAETYLTYYYKATANRAFAEGFACLAKGGTP